MSDDDAPVDCPPVDAADLERVMAALAKAPADADEEASLGLVGSVLPDRPDYYRAAVILRMMAFGAVFEVAPERLSAFMTEAGDGVVIGQGLLTAVAQAPMPGPDGFDIDDLVARAAAASG
jgi:hypothetical protein